MYHLHFAIARIRYQLHKRPKPRSGESPPAPGFSRGNLNLITEHKPRKGRKPSGIGIGRLSCLRHFVRLVFEHPRLKPGAGGLSPLRGLRHELFLSRIAARRVNPYATEPDVVAKPGADKR